MSYDDDDDIISIPNKPNNSLNMHYFIFSVKM